MFTGIIEDSGRIRGLRLSGLSVSTVLDGIKTGDSVAVNGICLTVTRLEQEKAGSLLYFDFSPETARRTSLQGLGPGDPVNLERALRLGDRLGGHFLSGHVEETGKLLSVALRGESYLMTFSASKAMERYIVPKGSIGVDGISLTIAARGASSFTVAVIGHTYKNTNLRTRKAGDPVNLEPDLLAKYVENFLSLREESTGVSSRLLKENGFI
ncbi:MAG: riboflavin synthase [Endomicrobiales bacterium]